MINHFSKTKFNKIKDIFLQEGGVSQGMRKQLGCFNNSKVVTVNKWMLVKPFSL